jgi:hypothetical protein
MKLSNKVANYYHLVKRIRDQFYEFYYYVQMRHIYNSGCLQINKEIN